MSANPEEALSSLLKYTGRTNASFSLICLSAIGLDLQSDVELKHLIPDPSYIPDFSQWDHLTPDEAREQNSAEPRPLRNGNLSPGCQVYIERYRELSNTNEDAFRTVRRIPPPKGKQQARLGNAYEFFRCLELFTSYWDDPTQPLACPLFPELSTSELNVPPTSDNPNSEGGKGNQNRPVVRSADGAAMPAEFRQNLVSAFIKLVSYDFGCNVSMARLEPRLQLSSPDGHRHPRKSYLPSNCHFLFQSPTTREAARAGTVHGPLAVVSARPSVSFTTPDVVTAQAQDLAREVLAVLITAQHRAREGKMELRFGEGQWWTCKPRWGGGLGGPIGREVENHAPQVEKNTGADDSEKPSRPVVKKPRRNLSMYDNYRMVRPPAYTWDRKARYEAIGKQRGANFDDIFMVSSLFHHVSILRVRVPARLLEVLDGSSEPEKSERSWGKVQGWRSPWFDLFDTEQRITAMKAIWSMMAYQMRNETECEDSNMMEA